MLMPGRVIQKQEKTFKTQKITLSRAFFPKVLPFKMDNEMERIKSKASTMYRECRHEPDRPGQTEAGLLSRELIPGNQASH